jgi:hypothetical protein
MIPFRSAKEMLTAHEQMFGEAGRRAAGIVLHWASKLFAVPLDALNIRVVLAPVELGPYNRHTGYCAGGEGEAAFILGNRHMVRLEKNTLVLVHGFERMEDFIVHELTHHRQQQLVAAHPGDPAWQSKRGGTHRNRAWYQSIAEAAPNYLGVRFPETSWPTGRRPKKGGSQLSEVEATHWPTSFRLLLMGEDGDPEAGDPRLPKVQAAAQQLLCCDDFASADGGGLRPGAGGSGGGAGRATGGAGNR